MAVSEILKDVKSVPIRGTTGSTGNLQLTGSLPSGAIPISAQCNTPYMGIPFKSGDNWYLKVIAYNNTSFSVANNVSITATVWYTN